MNILIIVVCVLVLFLVTVIIRAFLFKPQNNTFDIIDSENIDNEKCVKCLSELIKCKTISNSNSELEDEKEFIKLKQLLPELYPNVYKECEIKEFDGRGLLFHWKGKSNKEPTVLMAHYDVVDVNESAWEKPPFEAIIENGVMWGRGTLDTKTTFNAILFSVNQMISKGFTPENDIYLAFSGGEEVNGIGAIKIVDYFEQNNITPSLVVDEGGAVVENVFPGVKKPCALIGIAEKGLINLEYKTMSQGGHASAPAVKTPIGMLSKACCKVEAKPPKGKLTKPVLEMFNTLGRHSSFAYKILFANLWCFKGILDMYCKLSGGELNALMRSTIAFTMMKGSSGRNVIPPEATMISNIRLNPLDTVESVKNHIEKVINNDKIKVTVLEGNNPSPISETDCKAYNTVKNAIANTWKDTIVSPYLMLQCSDSRHYGRISNHVYRFSAMELTAEERKTIHGNNERIRLENIVKAAEFYIRLIKQL